MAALNAEIPDDLKRKLDLAVAHRDVTLKSAITEAITQWLGGNEKAERESDPDVEKLLEFKRIGEKHRVSALLENISVFLEQAKDKLAERRRKRA